jgi:hypothetical protein
MGPRPLQDRVTAMRGLIWRHMLRVGEQFIYDVSGLTMALPHLLRLRRPSPDLPPVAYIHRFYGYAFFKLPFGPFRALIAAVFWPILFVAASIIFTTRNGTAIAARSGVGVMNQVAGQVFVAVRYSVAPFWFYMFELWDPLRRRMATKILTAHETIGPAYSVLQPPPGADGLDDKVWFARHCRERDIRAVPVLFLLSRGTMVPQLDELTALPSEDLFVKPRSGSGGHRMERWDVAGDGLYCNSKGQTLDRDQLTAMLIEKSLRDDFLIQPRLANHPDLDDISNGALATVRLLTIRNEEGRAEATNAAFRMAVGGNSVVDNFHQGGLATAVDLETGRIGEASDLGASPHMGWREVHPVSGVRFAGRTLPLWREVVDLAVRTHEAFPERVIVGWDVAMLADGACVIEGNGRPDLDIHQRAERRPLGESRIARLLVHNVEKALGR